MSVLHLIGKTIFALRGEHIRDNRISKKSANHEVQYILFDDKETVLELEDQCYYDYHDCDSSAKVLKLHTDDALWNRVYTTHYAAELGMDLW